MQVSSRHLRYLWAWSSAILCIGAFFWIATVGQPLRWDGQGSNHYHLLARQFLAGTTAMPGTVPPELLNLASPFDPAARTQAKIDLGPHWDRTLNLRTGKTYLYFGPLPAGVFALYHHLTGYDFPGVGWNLLCAFGAIIVPASVC